MLTQNPVGNMPLAYAYLHPIYPLYL